jgi:hypothetical protein
MKRITFALLTAAAITAAGCLTKDTTSTVYLRPDGSFDWTILEQNVRSGESDAAAREVEESRFVDEVSRADLGMVSGLLALGARNVDVRWLRSTRPYAVMVDARFDDLASVFDRLLTRCEVPHETRITEADGVTTWTLRIEVGPDGEAPGSGDGCDDGLSDLIDALDFTVVLESGTFTRAIGFTLRGIDTAAIDEKAIEQGSKATGRVELSLSWKPL